MPSPVVVRSRFAVTVVAAAPGYPAAPELGATIVDAIDDDGAADAISLRFDAGVRDGAVAGGRVLAHDRGVIVAPRNAPISI